MMQDLAEIRITVVFDDGVGNEEEFRMLLTPVHGEDGSVKFVPGEVEKMRLPYAVSWQMAHQLCQRLTRVSRLLEESLLNPNALYPEEK
jgi:hypothetical protein